MNVSVYEFSQLMIIPLILKNTGYSGRYLIEQIIEIHLFFYKESSDLIILSGKKTQLVVCIWSIISLNKLAPIGDAERRYSYCVDPVGLSTANALGAIFLHSQGVYTADKNAVR